MSLLEFHSLSKRQGNGGAESFEGKTFFCRESFLLFGDSRIIMEPSVLNPKKSLYHKRQHHQQAASGGSRRRRGSSSSRRRGGESEKKRESENRETNDLLDEDVIVTPFMVI